MKKTIFLICFLLTVAATGSAQTVLKAEELNLKVTWMLFKKDLRALADELAERKTNKVADLLLRLDVFARAGQTERIRRTVNELSETVDLPALEAREWVLDIVRRKISGDLVAQRIYYERLTPDDGYYNTNPFVGQWLSEGNEKELEAWLEKRAVVGSSWFTVNLERRLKAGTAQPILDQMAARVRENPGDRKTLHEYLNTVKLAQEYTQNKEPKPFAGETDWLAELCQAQNAWEAYNFGAIFDPTNPALAIRYYLDSLARPFTADDRRAIGEKYQFRNSMGESKPIDWEKQLRYWTKQKLAAAYQKTGQAALAQPLIEELLAAKNDDVFSEDNFGLAGAVQASSGARVIESKVLQDEVLRSDSTEYWRERLKYYEGRREYDAIVQSLRDALAKIPSGEKARFISWFADFYRYSPSRQNQPGQIKPRMTQILLDEFNRAPLDSELAFNIIKAASGNRLGLSDFNEALFIRRGDVLSAVFAKRPNWNYGIDNILEDILEDQRLAPERKSSYIAELEKIARNGPVERLHDLAELFKDMDEHARMIPLILEYLERAPKDSKNESDRTSALHSLFDAYFQTGDWQAAEKLLKADQNVFLGNWGLFLQYLAICAARQNAGRDALRFWLQAVNFSGHAKFGLMNLADTPAKPVIREYYLRMKLREPDSPIPDEALKILR